MIIGRRRYLSDTHFPMTRRDSWQAPRHPTGRVRGK
jgi:hypothetical protein